MEMETKTETEMEKAKLDLEEVLQLAEQMVNVVEGRASSEASFLGELSADLFHISLPCLEDHVELLTILEDLQKQITAVEHALQEAENVDQSNVCEADLQKRKDDLLRRERSLKAQERSLQNTLEHLSKQRQALQTQKESLKKFDAEMPRNQTVLALCASIFHMIASDGGSNGVAGSLVDSKGCVVDTFGFNTQNMDGFDVCEKLWSLCTTI